LDYLPTNVRVAAFAKTAALFSAILTMLPTGMVLSWQLFNLITTGEWPPFPISTALALAGLEYPVTYVTASVPEPVGLFDLRDMLLLFLDLPASGFLSFIAAILLGFSTAARLIEKQYAASKS
jgi:hypothetical protein